MEFNNKLVIINNNIIVNKMIERLLLIVVIVPLAYIILTLAGIWCVDYVYSCELLVYVICVFIAEHFFNKEAALYRYAMHFGLLACIGFILLLSSNNSIEISIIYAVIPFVASLYYNRKFTIAMTLCSFVIMILSVYMESDGFLANYYENTKNWSDLDWFLAKILGYTVEYFFVFLAALFLSIRIKKTLEELMEQTQYSYICSEKLMIKAENLKEKQKALTDTQTKLIEFIANLLGSHDLFTGRHVIHTQTYVTIIAKKLREMGCYSQLLTPEYINVLRNAAFLHDIGKIHIPEGILNKAGKFTPEEFALMQCHPEEGKKLLEALPHIDTEDPSIDFNKTAIEMAYCHHEKWDGTGYPRKLKGEEIPVSARIMAGADVLDALISRRLYKAPMSIEAAMKIFEDCAGTHFAPEVAQAVIACKEEIREADRKFKEIEQKKEVEELEWWKNYHAQFAQQ